MPPVAESKMCENLALISLTRALKASQSKRSHCKMSAPKAAKCLASLAFSTSTMILCSLKAFLSREKPFSKSSQSTLCSLNTKILSLSPYLCGKPPPLTRALSKSFLAKGIVLRVPSKAMLGLCLRAFSSIVLV